MSLDFMLRDGDEVVFCANITHNLGLMALECGLYWVLWRPEELGIELAKDAVEPIREGLAELIRYPTKYKSHNPPNGWGSYEGLVSFASEVQQACEENSECTIVTCR